MNISILPDADTLTVPDLLDADGLLKLLPAAAYDEIPWQNLRLFCHIHSRYGLPTVELVQWLKAQIARRAAIEIGSGAGDLAFHLGIPATDNRMQEWPRIKRHYKVAGQPTIKYPDFVRSLDAVGAVHTLKPQVVIASWVTQWIDGDGPVRCGNPHGVKEEQILALGVTYILIGNIAVHGDKQIMGLPHQEHNLPFLRSRAHQPELNRVWVWNP